MTAEHLPAHSGITEYQSDDGLVSRFHPSSHEREWESFGKKMTFMQGREAAAGLLTRDFVIDVFGQMDHGTFSFDAVDVTLAQQGLKNAIYKVRIGQKDFILVMSKGTPQLKAEVTKEAQNLRGLKEAVKTTQIPNLVPTVYGYNETDSVGGYAFELLPKHFELRGVALNMAGKYYTTFAMINEDPAGRMKRYNERVGKMTRQWMLLPSKRQSEDPNYRIKTELAARLYVIYKTTGYIPKEFSVNAGDFMADPDKVDFDLRLITVRGGWTPQTDTGFHDWLYNLQNSRPTLDEAIAGLQRPVFDYDETIIQEGLRKGERLLQAA